MNRSIALTALLSTVVIAVAYLALSPADGQTRTGPVKTDPRGLFLDVRDVGAVGDGKADDTAALQKAFDLACSDTPQGKGPRRVVLAPGAYRVTAPLVLTPEHADLVVEGTGGHRRKASAATLLYDGPEGGDLMQTWATFGLVLRGLRFDGQGKAGKLLRVNSIDNRMEDKSWLKKFGQRAGGESYYERVSFSNAKVGVVCGDASYINAADMTLVDCSFGRCTTGFQTLSEQNLNYTFIRPEVGNCDVGLHFKAGGSVFASMLTGHSCGEAIRIDTGGINGGTYHFTAMRVETRMYKGKRTRILYASGETNVTFTALETTCLSLFGPDGDRETPMFTVVNGAQVRVEGSMICGQIAKLTSKPGGVPSMLTFEDCRFRVASDPRGGIERDADSGFVVRDCIVVQDRVEGGGKIVGGPPVLLRRYARYPKTAAPKDVRLE